MTDILQDLTIKPLTWIRSSENVVQARTPFGRFRVENQSSEGWERPFCLTMTFGVRKHSFHPSEADARAEAESLLNDMVLQMITTKAERAFDETATPILPRAEPDGTDVTDAMVEAACEALQSDERIAMRSAIAAALASPDNPAVQRAEELQAKLDTTLYAMHHADFSSVGLSYPADGMRQCTGLSLDRLAAAKRLRTAGLVTIEDSANGPLVAWVEGRGMAAEQEATA